MEIIAVSKPPADIFNKKSIEAQQVTESQGQANGNQIERIDYPNDGGIYRHYYDYPYPIKGHPYKEAVDGLQAPKKFVMATGHFIQAHPLISAVLVLIPGMVRSYLDIYLKPIVGTTIDPHLLDDKRYTPAAREIKRAGMAVAETLSPKWREYWELLLRFFYSMVEWDDAYRYRIQDGLGEINKENFKKNPGKEIMRIATIQMRRERGWYDDKGKYTMLGKAVGMGLRFLPSLRRAMIAFIEELDLEKIKLDEQDEFFCNVRPDYDIHGWPLELRHKKYLATQNKYVQENQERIQRGKEKEVQVGTVGLLITKLLETELLPVLVFYVTKENDQSVVKLLETGVSMRNPDVKVACRDVLDDFIKKQKTIPVVQPTA